MTASADKPRILVVDDTAANRYAVARTLASEGFDVLETDRGERALELARSTCPDVIVLDVKLPDIMGFEVAQRLRENPDTAAVGILQLSATYTDADAQATGLAAGADAYLLHPFDARVLIATVRALLRMRSAERRAAQLLAAERSARADAERARESAERSESGRRRVLDELEQTVRARDEFLTIATHDIKSPLSALQLSLGILLRTLQTRDEPLSATKLSAQIAAASARVQRIVDLLESLLDVSRINSGRLDIRREPDVDLAKLAREVAERMRDQFAAAGCALQLDAAEPVCGHWDRLRLEQVMANLFSNAAKYGAGKPVAIIVTDSAASGRLSVRDEGIGIAPEDCERIFKQFERLRPDAKRKSFGLGLWIVQRIVDALGGVIRVESELGRGSTFSVELPKLAPEVQGA